MKVRYKAPQSNASQLLAFPVSRQGAGEGRPSEAFRFSAAVASFGMLLRGSEYRASSSFDLVNDLAKGALGSDRGGYKREFLQLVRQARSL